jgi:hypothetical protein
MQQVFEGSGATASGVPSGACELALLLYGEAQSETIFPQSQNPVFETENML